MNWCFFFLGWCIERPLGKSLDRPAFQNWSRTNSPTQNSPAIVKFSKFFQVFHHVLPLEHGGGFSRMVGFYHPNSGEAKDWDQVLPDVSGGPSWLSAARRWWFWVGRFSSQVVSMRFGRWVGKNVEFG